MKKILFISGILILWPLFALLSLSAAASIAFEKQIPLKFIYLSAVPLDQGFTFQGLIEGNIEPDSEAGYRIFVCEHGHSTEPTNCPSDFMKFHGPLETEIELADGSKILPSQKLFRVSINFKNHSDWSYGEFYPQKKLEKFDGLKVFMQKADSVNFSPIYKFEEMKIKQFNPVVGYRFRLADSEAFFRSGRSDVIRCGPWSTCIFVLDLYTPLKYYGSTNASEPYDSYFWEAKNQKRNAIANYPGKDGSSLFRLTATYDPLQVGSGDFIDRDLVLRELYLNKEFILDLSPSWLTIDPKFTKLRIASRDFAQTYEEIFGSPPPVMSQIKGFQCREDAGPLCKGAGSGREDLSGPTYTSKIENGRHVVRLCNNDPACEHTISIKISDLYKSKMPNATHKIFRRVRNFPINEFKDSFLKTTFFTKNPGHSGTECSQEIEHGITCSWVY
jgi:hypothetical protein